MRTWGCGVWHVMAGLKKSLLGPPCGCWPVKWQFQRQVGCEGVSGVGRTEGRHRQWMSPLTAGAACQLGLYAHQTYSADIHAWRLHGTGWAHACCLADRQPVAKCAALAFASMYWAFPWDMFGLMHAALQTGSLLPHVCALAFAVRPWSTAAVMQAVSSVCPCARWLLLRLPASFPAIQRPKLAPALACCPAQGAPGAAWCKSKCTSTPGQVRMCMLRVSCGRTDLIYDLAPCAC